MPGRGRFKSVEEWPELDRLAWLHGTSSAGLLDDNGHAAKWRPAMVLKTARGFATWLNWQECEAHLAFFESAVKYCTNQNIEKYSAYLEANVRPVTVRSYLVGLERALSVVAPSLNTDFIKKTIRKYPKTGDQYRKRQRLRDPVELLHLGFGLMSKADAKSQPTRRDATKFRDGLMIGLLTLDAPRLSNLATIEQGQQLKRGNTGWNLEALNTEMKTHQHRLRNWPSLLVPELERYLSIYRPLLLRGRPPTNHLWVSERSGALTDNGIFYAITSRTRIAFGESINPHLFRDALVTSMAINDPKNTSLARHVLGNSEATMQQHYNLARSIEASDSLNSTFDKLLRKACRNRSSRQV